jgi:hypothetical protein
MPPPLTECAICKKSVLKAQTYAIGNGQRACKIHEGVLDKKAELEQQQKHQKEVEVKRAAEKHKQLESRDDFVSPRCVCCQRTGITEREVYFSLAIAQKRLSIKNLQCNPFSEEYHKLLQQELKEMGFEQQPVISTLAIDGSKEMKKAVMASRMIPPSLLEFTGIVHLCQDCINNFGIKKPEVKLPSLETLSVVGAMMDGPLTEAAMKTMLP